MNFLKSKVGAVLSAAVVILVLGVGVFIAVSPKEDNTPLKNPAAESYRKKLTELKKKAESSPKNLGSQQEYATALYVVQKLNEAKVQYEKAIALSPKDPVLYNSLGNVCRDLKDYKAAVTAYNKAIELGPNQLNAYTNLANMQIFMQKDVDGGIATYTNALKKFPGDAGVRLMLGTAYERKGNKAKAEETYKAILADDGNNVAAKNNLARLTGK
jgi:tetratricopeptide (TPR) repeat protein